MEQHTHLQQHPSVALESKVGLPQNIESLAHAAVKNIPNATEFLQNYFSKGSTAGHGIPRTVTKDQIQHLGFGTTY